MEDLLCVKWRSPRRTIDSRVTLRIVLHRFFHCVFGLQHLDRKWCGWGRGLSLKLHIFKALQTDHIPVFPCAWQQGAHVLAKFGAHAEIDERVVEAGRLGEEPGDDAGCAWHMEPPGRPHGHDCVGRPGHDESRANYNGNLERGT